MKDLGYFITVASNSTQREFELDFADVIEVYDTNETTIITECGRTLIITWEKNYYKSYRVINETEQMASRVDREVILKVIEQLKYIEVDGETMQYILKRVGMEDQMLRQLAMKSDIDTLNQLIEEKRELDGDKTQVYCITEYSLEQVDLMYKGTDYRVEIRH